MSAVLAGKTAVLTGASRGLGLAWLLQDVGAWVPGVVCGLLLAWTTLFAVRRIPDRRFDLPPAEASEALAMVEPVV